MSFTMAVFVDYVCVIITSNNLDCKACNQIYKSEQKDRLMFISGSRLSTSKLSEF